MGTVLQRVYPWMLLVVFQSVLMWTMITGLLNIYVFLAGLMSFLTNLWSLSIVDWRKEMNQSAEIVLIIGQTYVVGQICAGLGTLAIYIRTQYPRETQGIIFASVVAILAATAVSKESYGVKLDIGRILRLKNKRLRQERTWTTQKMKLMNTLKSSPR